MNPDKLFTASQPHGIQFDSAGGGTSKPEFTIAEVAYALGGLSLEEREPCYAAFVWRNTADVKERDILRKYLRNEVWLGYETHAPYARSDIEKYKPALRHLIEEPDWESKYLVLADRERWPRLIRTAVHTDPNSDGMRYIDKLVRLAVDEERMTRHANEAHLLSPEHPLFESLIESYGLPGVNEMLWRRRLQRRYMAIRGLIDAWYHAARSHASKKLNR